MKKLLLSIWLTLAVGATAIITAAYLLPQYKSKDFITALREIRADCKQVELTPQRKYIVSGFSGDEKSLSYITDLATKIDKSIVYDTNQNIFLSPEGDVIFIEAFSSDPNTRPVNQQTMDGPHCWVLWTENTNGNGKLAYKNKSENVKTIRVSDFIYFMNEKQ